MPSILNSPRNIGLDVDGVLANFGKGIIRAARILGIEYPYRRWYEQDSWMPEDAAEKKFYLIWNQVMYVPKFWLSLEPFWDDPWPDYTPGAYITSRPIETAVTEEWLERFGFPKAKVITVPQPEGKIRYCRQLGITHFVDDRPETYVAMREVGIDCYLMDRPWNKSLYEAQRVYTVNDIVEVQ